MLTVKLFRILLQGNKVSQRTFSVLSASSNEKNSIKVITAFTPSIYKFQLRHYPKNRDKLKSVAKKVQIREDIISQYINVEKLKMEMETVLQKMKEQYIQNLSLRSSTGSVEAIPIEFEGKQYTIRDLAQVNRKNPKMIALNLAAFPQTIPIVMEAITNSNMNLNPQQDGTSIYVPLPKITRDHRESLTKNANVIFMESKTNLRAVQIKYIKKLELKQNDGLSVEQFFILRDQITAFTNVNISKAERIKIDKIKELLGD